MCNQSRLRSMALDDSSGKQSQQQQQQQQTPRASSGNGEADLKLRRFPKEEHKPENYEDLPLEYSPTLFSSLERYLPDQLLNSTRIEKVRFMRGILQRHFPETERVRILRHKEYRDKIVSSYQRLHEELYTLDPTSFFLPSFLTAVSENSELSLRRIMLETSPGIFTFEMLQPRVCELLIAEVEHMEKWVYDSKSTIMRPNTLNSFGVVLDDFGFESMLQQLVDDFISPISKVLFPESCGSSLDSHHGYIVEYGKDRDVELGFHVDDSEVSLNVCLGKQFSGGELFFRGVRCDAHVNSEKNEKEDNSHVNSESTIEEVYDYTHVPGHAVLHRGRHRHGARATISGHRVNLILWCRSSTFREMKNYQRDFSSWCGECKRDKQKRQRDSVNAAKEILTRRAAEKTLAELGSKSCAD